MSVNINNKNKDINNTSISDSSEEEDNLKNSSDKLNTKNGDSFSKNKVEYINENGPELCIHITDDPKTKKYHAVVDELFYHQFINAIIKDDKTQAEKIIRTCKASEANDMISQPTKEGLTPIQYAALYSSINSFQYLLSLKAQTNLQVEGLHLIHLSLARGIFVKNQEKCIKMFNYIYEKLPEQRKYRDRLGRTFLHLVFEYDFMEAINEKKITT